MWCVHVSKNVFCICIDRILVGIVILYYVWFGQKHISFCRLIIVREYGRVQKKCDIFHQKIGS